MLVFTKKRYVKAEGKRDYRYNKLWVDDCNGREVIKNKLGGYSLKDGSYSFVRQWCKEV